MSIRRLFWLGAAVLFSIAALIAIVAVVGGGFGHTEARILATCGIAFVCGSVALAGVACLDREIIRPAALAAIALGAAGFGLWTGGAWGASGDPYWKLTGVVGAWLIAALIVTTSRLIASSPSVLRTVIPATWVAVTLAAALGSVMILGETGRPWKFELVLVILTALGYALIPALQRFWANAETSVSERLLGTVGNIDVFAVRGGGRSVTIGSSRMSLASSERVVLREHT